MFLASLIASIRRAGGHGTARILGRGLPLSIAVVVVLASGAAATIISRGAASATARTKIGGASAASAAKVKTVQVMGGAHYFASKSPADAWMDKHILIGGWMEQPLNGTQVKYSMRMGENIYWAMAGVPGHDVANFNVIRAEGMHVIASQADAQTGSETAGFQGSDEADMDYGPGNSSWDPTSDECVPSGSQCGYTVARYYYSGQPSSLGALPYPLNGEVINQGFGKGVLFWESSSQAAEFLDYSDILSADSYWLTDSGLQSYAQGGCALLPKSATACEDHNGGQLTEAESALPANYAYNVTRLAQLQKRDGASKPILVDVETGCPFTGDDAGNCATPPASIAAAWHGLIAGARGVLWFQHNFSGPCIDDRTFMDGSDPRSPLYSCQQTPGVTLHDLVKAVSAFDHEVKRLNNVLLSPTLDGYVKSTGDVSVMAKAYHGSCYVFAGAGRPGRPPKRNATVRFKLADSYSGKVEVYDARRSVRAVGGSFTDTFANEDAVHIYKISGDRLCRDLSS